MEFAIGVTDTFRMPEPTAKIASPITPARRDRGAISVEPSDTFIHTPAVDEITDRALAYLKAGYPVHMSGPAGTGKTTLAFHIAALRGRPVSLIHGNDAFGGTDLMGRDSGYRKSTVVDNYIHSVVKTEEKLDLNWTDNRVTIACERGHTLIYDEFNRTRAEANNVLLSIIEEGILSVPQRGGYIRVHPEFRLLLTSNPSEYAGVHKTQDALADRLISIRCGHYDAATERLIVGSASAVSPEAVAHIVSLVRSLRGEHGEHPRPTIRAAIALARVSAEIGAVTSADDDRFVRVAWDILGDDAQHAAGDEPISIAEFRELIRSVIDPASASRQGRRGSGRLAA